MPTRLSLTCLVGVAVLCSPIDSEAQDADAQNLSPGASVSCAVSRIVDGDTLDCTDSRRVRLLLIDTPEMGQGPFGELARQALVDLIPLGSEVTLEIDIEAEDRYGRTLAYVTLGDGRIVNEELLRLGVAVVSVYPPNVLHVERFRAASEEAQLARLGLWAVDAFECLPADFRSGAC